MSDFRNVFGTSLRVAIGRLPKALAILRSAMQAKDTASPRLPIKIQIEVTDRCNYRCIMCDRENLKNSRVDLNNTLPLKTAKKLMDEVGPFYLTLNGLGEPLMNKEIFGFLEHCNHKKLNSSMPTNLGYINDELFEQLIRNAPTILTVSMHGATPETYEAVTLSKTYDKFIVYMEKLLETLGPQRLRILCALQAKNLNEHEAFYAVLSKWKMLENFCLVPVFDFQTPVPEEHRVVPTDEEKAAAIKQLGLRLGSATPAEKRFLAHWREKILEIRASAAIFETGPCLVPWISTYVTSKGDVLPCCYLTSEVHKMGNLHDKPFSDIWNGPEYREFRKRMREDRGRLEGCQHCPRNDASRVKKYGFIAGRHGWRPAGPAIDKL